MEQKSDRMAELIGLVEKNASEEGVNVTMLPHLELYLESEPYKPKPLLYKPFFVFIAQGRKRSVLDNLTYEYDAGHFLVTLAPMPLECQVLEASEDKPLLAIAILLDHQRILNILMRIGNRSALLRYICCTDLQHITKDALPVDTIQREFTVTGGSDNRNIVFTR